MLLFYALNCGGGGHLQNVLGNNVIAQFSIMSLECTCKGKRYPWQQHFISISNSRVTREKKWRENVHLGFLIYSFQDKDL